LCFVSSENDMKTTLPKTNDISRAWLLVDADGKILGRLATKIADALRGRTKPIYTPHIDTGDFVVVVNAEKVKLTGKKEEQKLYDRYSGFRGGLKRTKASTMRALHPDRMITLAVKGMMPKNHLAKNAMKRLKVYAGTEHPHVAQNPQAVEL
jgi:large subunit ribosomal protein L13